MEQFNLDKWLQNKSRKIVTRDGRPVRIVCWDCKNEQPIIALTLEPKLGIEIPRMYSSNGIYHSRIESSCDLFFADEEKLNSIIDELKSYLEKTPKEQVEKDWKEIQDWYTQHFTNEKHDEEEIVEFEEAMVSFAHTMFDHLLDITKEVNIEEWKETLLNLARKKILKDLPNWEKCDDNLPYSHIGGLNNRYLIKNGYCIKISDLETLPKEE